MYNDYANAIDKLYEACLWASPDEPTRRAFKQLRDDIAKPDWCGDYVKEQLHVLTGALYGGLAYGNWPHEKAPKGWEHAG